MMQQIHVNLAAYLGWMLERHGHWSEPTQFFAVSFQETSVKVPENCPPPLVGLEFDSDSSSEMERISHPQHIIVNVYDKPPKHTKMAPFVLEIWVAPDEVSVSPACLQFSVPF